jgi:hypothetical protein
MTTNTDQKLDAILEAIKSLEARVTRVEADNAGAGADQKDSGPRGSQEIINQRVPA